MKVTVGTQKVTRIEPEEGDTLDKLWKAVGSATGGGWPVRIVDGAILAVEPIQGEIK